MPGSIPHPTQDSSSVVCPYHGSGYSSQSIPLEREVVIIGNGPSALTMAYLLQGHLPHYTGGQVIQNQLTPPHPDHLLHQQLTCAPKGSSLLDMDLPHLAHHYNQQGSARVTDPVARLIDSLAHPLADIDPDEPTRLGWRKTRPAVPYIMLGKGTIGGVWAQLADSDMKALSHHAHLELPGYSFATWRQSMGIEETDWRPTRREVAQYYRDYARVNGIDRQGVEGAEVLQIQPITNCCCSNNKNSNHSIPHHLRKLPCTTCKQYRYLLKGVYRPSNNFYKVKKFTIFTQHVVLATGSFNIPIPLKITGETLPGVFTDTQTMLDTLPTNPVKESSLPVLVVGSGLSAADAILALKRRGQPVLHVFYSPASYPRDNRARHPLANCWKDEYPEYHAIYQLMRGKASSSMEYEGFSDGKLLSLESASTTHNCHSLRATILSPDGIHHTRSVLRVVVLVGRTPNLNLLVTSTPPLPVTWNPSPSSTIYPIGALAGSSFVRHILPTCLLTYRTITDTSLSSPLSITY